MAFKLDFNKLKNMPPEEKELADAKMYLNLADWSLNDLKKGSPKGGTNQCVYDLLSALKHIPGMDIDMQKYAHLSVLQPDVDLEALKFAKKKHAEAKEIVAEMHRKVDESKVGQEVVT